MDKIAYAIAIFANALLMIAGHYFDATALKILGGFGAGAFTVKLLRP